MSRCVGCQETDAVFRVSGLGGVCESCHEVLDIVYEVELERVQEATALVNRFIEETEALI